MVSKPLVIPLVVLKVLYIAIQVKPLHIELIYYRAYRRYIYRVYYLQYFIYYTLCILLLTIDY